VFSNCQNIEDWQRVTVLISTISYFKDILLRKYFYFILLYLHIFDFKTKISSLVCVKVKSGLQEMMFELVKNYKKRWKIPKRVIRNNDRKYITKSTKGLSKNKFQNTTHKNLRWQTRTPQRPGIKFSKWWLQLKH
jgi:hypothetical protein